MAKKKRTKRLLFGGAIVVVLIVILVAVFGGGNDHATMVQADLAVLDDITELVTASGRIQPQTKVDIVAEVSAQIIALYVKEGDRVTKGNPLLLLDTIQLQANLAQARYSLDETTARAAASRTTFEEARLENDRQVRLYEQKLTSETAFTSAKLGLENAEATYRAMQAQVKTAQARLAQAEDNLTKTLITAPMPGVVTYLNAEVGEIAQGQTAYTQGRTLMTVADLSTFEVEVDVDETEVAKVAIGDEAKIRVDAFRDTSFAGTVTEIGNSAIIQGQGTDQYSTNFRVKIRFDDVVAGIRPGMSASVDVSTAKAKDVVLVPYAAVVTREFDPDSLKKLNARTEEKPQGSGELYAAELDDGDSNHLSLDSADTAEAGASKKRKKPEKVKISGVFLVKNGQATFVEINTGIADNRNIVALNGVAEGDTVISGSFQTLRRLRDGEAVRLDQRSIDRIREDAG